MQSGFATQVVPETILNPTVVENGTEVSPDTRGVQRQVAALLDEIHQASGRGDVDETLRLAARIEEVSR